MLKKTIRCGSGLGDALYLQSVARHLVQHGQPLSVSSNWPDVFRHIDVDVIPFRKTDIDIVAHYISRKGRADTDQFEDCCINAGIQVPAVMRLDWLAGDSSPRRRLLATGKPFICVQLPRHPMGRTDGFGLDLLPDCRVMQAMIDALRERFLIVQIGAGTPLFKFSGIDIDLANQTNVRELLDVASFASGFLGYCSFMVPLAESFDKPALFVWSRRGLRSGKTFIRQITPKKILHKDTSQYVFDDIGTVAAMQAGHEFLR